MPTLYLNAHQLRDIIKAHPEEEPRLNELVDSGELVILDARTTSRGISYNIEETD